MSIITESVTSDFTLADLYERLGEMPLWRIRFQPPPGTATEDDVIAIHEREKRLCELVDGILVEKGMGAYESYVAIAIASILRMFVRKHKLGAVLGEAGMMQLAPGLVRIPDVSFLDQSKFPDGKFPREPIPPLVPTLAIEVLSKSNTKKEMQRKLDDYFAVGVKEVWYVHPSSKQVAIYTSPETPLAVVTSPDKISGREVLPGFELDLVELFAEPLGK